MLRAISCVAEELVLLPRHAAEDAAVPEVAEVGFFDQVEQVGAVGQALEGRLGAALAREHDLLRMLAELIEEIRGGVVAMTCAGARAMPVSLG